MLYTSEEPDEYKDGTCWAEKLRKGTLGGGAPGPVELLFRPWFGPRGIEGGSAASGTGRSCSDSEKSSGIGSALAMARCLTGLTLPFASRTESRTCDRRNVAPIGL
jgi:hypothetical protein